MATGTSSEDLDKSICTCSVCLELFKEPKILPCLHRYCKDCLNTLIHESHKIFRCPECWEEIEIPPRKADGFKTDFHLTQNVVKHGQIKKSLQMEQICICFNCPENPRAIAYCRACNDFLCKNCYNSHMTKKTLKDHQPQIMFLDDVESKNFTVDDLASMMDVPKCHAHPGNPAKLYCETCNTIPVCRVCTNNDHKGHGLKEVATLAKLRREKLNEKVQILEKIKDDMYLIPQKNAEGRMSLNVTHDDEAMTVNEKIKDVNEGIELIKSEKEAFKERALASIEKEMEKEIKQIKDKYKKIVHDMECKINDDFYPRQESLEMELKMLLEELEKFRKKDKEFVNLKETKINAHVGTLTASGDLDNIDKRIENLKVVAYGLLASKNDWAAVECIPAISAGIDNLMDDLTKKSLGSECDRTINVYARSMKDEPPRISEDAEKTVTIEVIQRGGRITGITSAGDGNIVITGRSSAGNESYIFVIDETGKTINEKKLYSTTNRPWRYCDYLSQFKVASVCERTEVGVYDVRNGSYAGKNISDVISSWPADREVRCVATDSVNKHILVGGYDSRDVYVFDDQLNYRGYTLTLPEVIKWPRDMTVRGSYLLVCDRDGKTSFVTTMGVSSSKVLRELKKPDGSYDWRPVNVCTDKNGFIYILWQAINKSLTTKRCVVVQYTQDGRQVLTARPVDGDTQCIATLETDEAEGKLLVQTWETGKLFIYGLV